MSGCAWRCEVCDGPPMWRLDRHGDAVVSWACASHLLLTCERLQRDWEITEITVRHVVKLREWIEIASTLDDVSAADAASSTPTGDTDGEG